MALGGNYPTYSDDSITPDGIEMAKDKGDLRELSDGTLYSDYYREAYWADGTRRD